MAKIQNIFTNLKLSKSVFSVKCLISIASMTGKCKIIEGKGLHSDVMINNSVQCYCQGMLSPKNKNGHKIFLYNMTHFNADEFGFVGLRMPFYADTHFHDLRYLIGKGLYSKFRPNWDDKHMMRIVGTLFTNFAKFGDPNISSSNRMKKINGQIANGNGTLLANGTKESLPSAKIAVEWLPIDPEDTYRHLELCLDPKMRSDYQGRRFEFWKKIEEEKEGQEEKLN